MKIKTAYILGLIGSLQFTSFNSMNAQLQYPGRPMGETRQMKASEVMYVLPPVDPLLIESLVIENHQSAKKPLQFAIERQVDLRPETHGCWSVREGCRIWCVHIISPGAFSLGPVFNKYRLEPGVKVFVYDPDRRQIKGAFTSANNKASGVLAVGHLPGNELIIEMQVPLDIQDYGILNVESVSHAFLDMRRFIPDDDCPAGEFGCSQDCEIDINCAEGDDWQLAKRSVVRIFTTRLYCSGVLINNTAYDGTPYVLTAEHCINHPYYADRSVFLFNYESPACFGAEGSAAMSISGCDTIAVGDSIDFSLVRLSVPPPDSFGAYYAGWDRSGFQTSGSTTIHHPWGDVKKITFDHDAPSTPSQHGDVPYADLDDYHYFSYWWIRNWEIGTTEGGSSGSPLFNGGQRIIGVLSGGVAKCGDSIGYDPETDRILYSNAFNYDDYYTKLGVAWDYYGDPGPSLKHWLDPGHSGATTIGGYLPTYVENQPATAGIRYRIHPNPVYGSLYISLLAPPAGSVRYTIFDLSGTMKGQGIIEEGGTGMVETGSLVPGLYILRLDAPGNVEYHRFIVAR
jgi:lysyl endopeptidase